MVISHTNQNILNAEIIAMFLYCEKCDRIVILDSKHSFILFLFYLLVCFIFALSLWTMHFWSRKCCLMGFIAFINTSKWILRDWHMTCSGRLLSRNCLPLRTTSQRHMTSKTLSKRTKKNSLNFSIQVFIKNVKCLMKITNMIFMSSIYLYPKKRYLLIIAKHWKRKNFYLHFVHLFHGLTFTIQFFS